MVRAGDSGLDYILAVKRERCGGGGGRFESYLGDKVKRT